MKRLLIVMVCVVGLMAASPAFASYWSFTPNGQVDVTGASQISFDLYFNNTGAAIDNGFTWDNWMQVDLTELTPHLDGSNYAVTYYGNWNSTMTTGARLDGDIFWVAAFNFDAYGSITSGANKLATITFDIVDKKAWDGVADLVALASNADDATGIQTMDRETWDPTWVLGSASTLNPDIGVPGAPVPIPGALWLLGSGLLGLVGIRRRTA